MNRSRGFILPNLYAVLAVVALAGAGLAYTQYLRVKVARVEAENDELSSRALQLEAQMARAAEMMANNIARNRAANDARIAAAVQAEREKQRVTAERLSEASRKKAGLVERLARKAIEDNVAVLNCKSDLRDSKECGNVR